MTSPELQGTLLITGGGGMLARALASHLASRRTPCTALPRSECDVTRSESLRQAFETYRPALLLNCAAHTQLDRAEEEPQLTDAVNGHAVVAMASLAREFGTRLVQFSTDAVFPGTASRPYTPHDVTGPISAYGRSKLLGERLLQQLDPPGWMIVRTAWLFGDGPCFPATIERAARAGKPLRVVSDQIGSPTYAEDLAEATLDLITRRAEGIWHVVNTGQASWFEVARATLEVLGLRADLTPVSTSDYLQTWPKQAPRLPYGVLDAGPFEQLTGRPIRHWLEALTAYRATFGNSFV